MNSQLVEYTCGNCNTEFDVRVYPAEQGTRDDPPHSAEIDPGECPHCGVEIIESEVLEKLRDYEDAEREGDAESRREMQREGI
jgi:DNA-directed RNA polymerase subunit RPC12/RpoP